MNPKGLVISILLVGSLHAQIVNDLERASDSHSSSSDCGSSSGGSSSSSNDYDNSSSSSSDYSSDSGSDDYNGDDSYSSSSGIILATDLELCGEVFAAPVVALIQAQENLLSRKNEVRRVVSVEASVPLGLSMDGYFTFAPQVRGNWGVFSTGFRYFNLTEPALEGRKSWITYDIEAIQFNVIQSKPVRLRIGTGLTIQDYQGLPFHEYLAGLDLHFLDQRIVLAGEGRVSTDYCNCGPSHAQRLEFNSSLRLRVMESEHVSLYSTYSYLHQNYYGLVKVWTAGAGLQMLLH